MPSTDQNQLDRDRAFVASARPRMIIKGVVAAAALVMVGYAGYEASKIPDAGMDLYAVMVIMVLLCIYQVFTIIQLGKQTTEARERIAQAERR